PCFLETHPAGRKIGHAAIFKFDAGIGDIGLLRQHGNSDSTNLSDGNRNKTQHNIDIVDHEIEDHVHVQAARRKRGEPMDLEKLRPSCHLASCRHDWIESFDVAYLQHAVVAQGSVD